MPRFTQKIEKIDVKSIVHSVLDSSLPLSKYPVLSSFQKSSLTHTSPIPSMHSSAFHQFSSFDNRPKGSSLFNSCHIYPNAPTTSSSIPPRQRKEREFSPDLKASQYVSFLFRKDQSEKLASVVSPGLTPTAFVRQESFPDYVETQRDSMDHDNLSSMVSSFISEKTNKVLSIQRGSLKEAPNPASFLEAPQASTHHREAPIRSSYSQFPNDQNVLPRENGQKAFENHDSWSFHPRTSLEALRKPEGKEKKLEESKEDMLLKQKEMLEEQKKELEEKFLDLKVYYESEIHKNQSMRIEIEKLRKEFEDKEREQRFRAKEEKGTLAQTDTKEQETNTENDNMEQKMIEICREMVLIQQEKQEANDKIQEISQNFDKTVTFQMEIDVSFQINGNFAKETE